MITLLLCVIVLFALLVPYIRQNVSFRKHGIKHFIPLPLIGNMGKVLLRKHHSADDLLNLYNSFPDERFVGRFEFMTEAIVIRDIELVKRITVKDFDHFINHRNFGAESFFTRTLFLLQGQEWKDMRSTLSPAFTTSKIRLMVPFMVEVGDQMIQSLKEKIGASKDDFIDIDCKDLTTRYTNDVIASCAFGLKVDSHTDTDNKFFEMGKTATNFGFFQMLVFFLMMNAPKLLKILDWDVISYAVRGFFTSLVLDTMKDREMHNIVRHDMIHLLMQAKKGKISHEDVKPNDDATGFATVEESAFGKKEINRVWKDEDLVAQALLFFFAGFESVSSSMSFLMYELAINPDVQERLAQEIREHDAKNGGKFDFNSIQDMTYMDMVVSEILRLWPPAAFMDRHCNTDYNMGKPNKTAETDFILRKGAGVMIPTYAFHRDPQYYPEPEKFNPERFSEKNKHKINPFAYMPFGSGPRNCIGKLSHDDTKSKDDAAGFATVEESTVGKRQQLRKWKDDDLVAQAFLFFVAGFESISSSMSFLLYELAVNPDVQERLVQEIREHDAKNGAKFDFSSMQSMTYLDMVVSEVLRKWPPFVVLDRQCTKEYNLGRPNDTAKKDYILKKGADLLIPTLAFHLDPQYYPDPEKFDPERFSDENKHKINPMTYMPFGIGPRNCIGSRFALCEVKVMVYQLLRHIELSPCEKTCIPAKLSPDHFNLRLQGGHWLRLKLRK